jgi:hypothetical protein
MFCAADLQRKLYKYKLLLASLFNKTFVGKDAPPEKLYYMKTTYMKTEKYKEKFDVSSEVTSSGSN